LNRRGLGISLGRTSFKNPVFLASGPAGYGTEYAGLVDLAKIGGIVAKTITLEPRPGNAGRRLWETPGGLLNSVGLENVGAEVFFSEKLPALIETGACVIVSLAAEEWKGYVELIAAADREEVHTVEINLSCPNVEQGGMAVGIEPALVERYVRHAREGLGQKTIIVKLTPNVADIVGLARVAQKAGADAVTAINTVLGMDVAGSEGRPVFRRISAGLSGPAIMPIALDAVWRIANAVSIPVIGVGGISSVEDARKFFMVGACAVQIGTALFYDHELPGRIVDSLAKGGIPAACRTSCPPLRCGSGGTPSFRKGQKH
jgi:dihydroorotate dehydrogenase (NAD+) catalytic subunit